MSARLWFAIDPDAKTIGINSVVGVIEYIVYGWKFLMSWLREKKYWFQLWCVWLWQQIMLPISLDDWCCPPVWPTIILTYSDSFCQNLGHINYHQISHKIIHTLCTHSPNRRICSATVNLMVWKMANQKLYCYLVLKAHVKMSSLEFG